MTLHCFDVGDLPDIPWKNGGGVTRELVCQPAGAGLDDFDWRVSVAHVVSDGPFSSFPGVDRIITLLEGGGVHLCSRDGTLDHLLERPLEPFAFAGDTPIHARLLSGDCHDFNVMTRRAACKASLQVLHHACAWSATDIGLFMAVQGRWQIEGPGAAETLLPLQGLWWSAAIRTWRLAPQSSGSSLLALSLQLHRP